MIAFPPEGQHAGYLFRRVLQIGVHEDGGFSRRAAQAGADGDGLAEAPRKPDQFDAGVRHVQAGDFIGCGIGAVVAENQLEIEIRQRLEHRTHARIDGLDIRQLIVRRDDDGDQRSRHKEE